MCLKFKICIPATGDASFLVLWSGFSWPKNVNLSLFCLYLTPLQIPSWPEVPESSYVQSRH